MCHTVQPSESMRHSLHVYSATVKRKDIGLIAQLSDFREILLDCCYMQVMLAMDDTGALLRFVQRPNDVDLREGEVALRARGRYSELVALYQQRGQHEAALDLLHTLTLSPQDLNIRPQGLEAIRAMFDLFICSKTVRQML